MKDRRLSKEQLIGFNVATTEGTDSLLSRSSSPDFLKGAPDLLVVVL
jgi:hypothetical protein